MNANLYQSPRRRWVRRLLAGMFSSPDAGNKTLSSGHVRRVLVTKLLKHHPLLCVYTKYEEDRECDQVRWTCHPIGEHKRLTDGIQQQRRVHGVADAAINALRDESMLFSYLERDRPVRAKVRVRPVEQPEAHHEAQDAGDERAGAKRIVSE